MQFHVAPRNPLLLVGWLVGWRGGMGGMKPSGLRGVSGSVAHVVGNAGGS